MPIGPKTKSTLNLNRRRMIILGHPNLGNIFHAFNGVVFFQSEVIFKLVPGTIEEIKTFSIPYR
jgi:hypothetical protein